MSDHISGQQARELLDGISPEPWEAQLRSHPMRGGDFISICPADEDGWMVSRSARTVCEVTDNHAPNAKLIEAAPALAETVAWLYGREPETHHPDEGTWWVTDGFLLALANDGVAVHDDQGSTTTYLTPDQIVDLARALLAAAEVVRE